ncbi:hypothetical protein [Burkholderia vietnamiensis]|nr:hypothetical protein [Burkholderia vietnamiensis]
MADPTDVQRFLRDAGRKARNQFAIVLGQQLGAPADDWPTAFHVRS